MTDTATLSANPEVQFARAMLLNVADAIHNVLLPNLPRTAQNRADECVAILARVAQQLEAAPATHSTTIPDLDPLKWLAVASAEQAACKTAERAFQTYADQINAQRPSGSRSFDQGRFEHYLRAHDLGGAGVRITQSTQLAGGRSKQTILVSQQGAKALPPHIVVRQDWASAVTGTSVVSEYELLLRVWRHGLRVPQPLLLEKSAEPLGAPFIVVTRVAGAGKGDIFNPPVSEPLALQVAAQLGKLHSLPVTEFQQIEVPTEAYDQAQLQAGLANFKALHAKLGLPIQSINIAIAWMEQNLHRVEGTRALLHNDLGCHNFLIEGDDLAAILDWELAHIGNPAADLGYIRGWIGKMTTWNRFMERYQASGGPAVSDSTLDFYTLWCGVRLYCLLLQARAGVAMGAVNDTEITYACAHFTPQLVHRITTELTHILEK